MKIKFAFKYVLLLLLLEGACTTPKQEKALIIATAANMQFAMAEIVHQFSEKTAIPCELVLSSSGKLTAQIIEGAPYDIFVAANMKYPEAISQSGLAENVPKIYAYGKIVLWSMQKNVAPSLAVLQTEAVKHIALANPRTAPYGIAAKEVLEYYTMNNKIKEKLVFGESIAQCNQFILSGAAEIGFTAKAVVLSPDMQGEGTWVELDTAAYTPIEQGIVQIKREEETHKAAIEFYNFIFSEEAKKILMNFGYSVNE